MEETTKLSPEVENREETNKVSDVSKENEDDNWMNIIVESDGEMAFSWQHRIIVPEPWIWDNNLQHKLFVEYCERVREAMTVEKRGGTLSNI